MKIGDKYFLNLQEAVAWLLANNALPFQCNVNYVANTEIAKTAIINPSPAEIKVGALVLFADSKVGTVSGITSNGFMVGPDYTDISDALAYITNIEVNASGNLICTLSDGRTINAGLLKQLSSMSIDASQHLIANYNDGTSTDLGAVFSGNITISGDFAVTGNAQLFEQIVDAGGHSRFQGGDLTIDDAGLAGLSPYAKWSLSGTHLMLVLAFNVSNGKTVGGSYTGLAHITLPAWIADKIVGMGGGTFLKYDGALAGYGSSYNELTKKIKYSITKPSSTVIYINWEEATSYTWDEAGTYRIQFDLLIDND